MPTTNLRRNAALPILFILLALGAAGYFLVQPLVRAESGGLAPAGSPNISADLGPRLRRAETGRMGLIQEPASQVINSGEPFRRIAFFP